MLVLIAAVVVISVFAKELIASASKKRVVGGSLAAVSFHCWWLTVRCLEYLGRGRLCLLVWWSMLAKCSSGRETELSKYAQLLIDACAGRWPWRSAGDVE